MVWRFVISTLLQENIIIHIWYIRANYLGLYHLSYFFSIWISVSGSFSHQTLYCIKHVYIFVSLFDADALITSMNITVSDELLQELQGQSGRPEDTWIRDVHGGRGYFLINQNIEYFVRYRCMDDFPWKWRSLIVIT